MVCIIAEAGVNHNGSAELAFKLIEKAVVAKVDAVKFQTFDAKLLAVSGAKKAKYQLETTDPGETQLAMLQTLELEKSVFHQLIDYAKAKDVEFISTPFDLSSLRFLVDELNVGRLKISSGDLNNGPLLLEFAKTQKEVILSTGMGSLADIEMALAVLGYGYQYSVFPKSIAEILECYRDKKTQALLKSKVTVLHCTTEYPAPLDEVNLRAMDTIHSSFGIPVGYSDHTMGDSISLAAVARGAVMIEKHFTLSRTMKGPDHRASLEPDELNEMVTRIRDVETALGDKMKGPTKSEFENIPIARKSLVAGRVIELGEVFDSENLALKRPGTGLSPMEYWRVCGKKSSRQYAEGDLIDE